LDDKPEFRDDIDEQFDIISETKTGPMYIRPNDFPETPNEINKSMIQYAPEKKLQAVIDPCCRTGSILKAFKEARNLNDDQLFAICSNEYDAMYTRWNLYGDSHKEGNVVVYDFINDPTYSKVNFNGTSLSDMKFDLIVGNPPFQRKSKDPFPLYAEIYTHCVTNLLSTNGTIIFVQPCNRINADLFSLKSGKDWDIIKKMTKKVSKWKNIGNMFGSLPLNYDIGIFSYSYGDPPMKFETTPIIQSILAKTKKFNVITDLPETGKFTIKLSHIHGHAGKPDYYDVVTPQLSLVFNVKLNGGKGNFNTGWKTKNEALNFYNSLNTAIMKFINKCHKTSTRLMFNYFPVMNDYTQPWDNDRLCNEMGLTDEEKNYVIEAMKPYMNSGNTNSIGT
jgi:hypothetical protein